jgi:aspartyl-tRNA(Asn)/glutamyl-tRNA(Gln) amidotransferase subunit A
VEGAGGQGVRGRRRADRAGDPADAPTLDQQTFPFDGGELPVRANVGLYTQPITFVGLPVVAAPLQNPGGLPLAVQLIGRPGGEAALMCVAKALEDAGVCAAPVAA